MQTKLNKLYYQSFWLYN